MKINFITEKENSQLLDIYKKYPALTLQNTGFEGIRKSDLTEEEHNKIKEIELILNKSISGFSRFQNFKLNFAKELQIRFKYNYNYEPNSGIPFIGVGYILVEELLKGFRD